MLNELSDFTVPLNIFAISYALDKTDSNICFLETLFIFILLTGTAALVWAAAAPCGILPRRSIELLWVSISTILPELVQRLSILSVNVVDSTP